MIIDILIHSNLKKFQFENNNYIKLNDVITIQINSKLIKFDNSFF